MNRRRYDGYRAVQDAIASQELAAHPAAVVGELAEGLLLARDAPEAGEAAARVPEGLAWLVNRGDLSRFVAHRFWAMLRACGPRLSWPASWDRHGR